MNTCVKQGKHVTDNQIHDGEMATTYPPIYVDDTKTTGKYTYPFRLLLV